MQPRVTAILVAPGGAHFLERTLAALSRQLRRPDALVLVDDGSRDGSAEVLASASPTQLVTLAEQRPFGAAVAHALAVAAPATGDDEWLWLLAHDNVPDADALRSLVSAVEIAPSVAVAGPKLMRHDDPATIARYGETVTPFGATVLLVVDELDQSQHDRGSDLLAVAASGMLVRRRVFSELGGFDPALPTVDAALDFCIRVRLAGHRIVGVPSARVASAEAPEEFGGRDPSDGARARIARAAQLHRRMTYAPAAALPLHWLSVLPLAIVRSIWHLLSKRPGAIPAEFRAAIGAIGDTGVAASRRNLSRHRRLGWKAIAPLRMPWTDVRRLAAHARDRRSQPSFDASARIRPSFLSNGGAWVVLLLAVTGVVAFGAFAGTSAVEGGALLPLSDTVLELWRNVGYGWRELGAGFVGAADPFAAVLAVLGSLTFWAPSAAVVGLYLVALPLAGLAAWWAAARFSERGWAPALAAILWALAPPFLGSLAAGQLGAVLVHLLLPWFVLALVGAAQSWSASAAAALLFAAIAASAPVLFVVLLLAWFAWLVSHPRGAHRIMGVPIPAILLFLPLVVDQGVHGGWLGLLADPGVPVPGGSPAAWQLALGDPDGGAAAWAGIGAALGLPELAGTVIAAALLIPLAVLAVLALYLPGSRRSIPALVVAFVGFAVAVVSSHLSVATSGAATVPIWPGAGLSVYWLGLVGGAAFAIAAIGRRVAVPTIVAAASAFLLAGPALAGFVGGTVAVTPGDGRTMPAFVTAEAASNPGIGTMVLAPQPDGGLGARLVRGAGESLDDQSTIASTRLTLDDSDSALAELAGNLASRSGFDTVAGLQSLQVGFVLLPDAEAGSTDAAVVTRSRTAEALDANAALEAVGDTDGGFLWHAQAVQTGEQTERLDRSERAVSTGVRVGLAVVFVVVTLLAIPTSWRRRTRFADDPTEPADTFDEVDDD